MSRSASQGIENVKFIALCMLPYLTNERTTTAWQKRNCRCEIYFSKECMSDARKKCLLEKMPPRKYAA